MGRDNFSNEEGLGAQLLFKTAAVVGVHAIHDRRAKDENGRYQEQPKGAEQPPEHF